MADSFQNAASRASWATKRVIQMIILARSRSPIVIQSWLIVDSAMNMKSNSPIVLVLLAGIVVVFPLAVAAQESSNAENIEETHYRINAERSWLRVLVYRGGLLRGLGHNHVISHNGITGRVSIGSAAEQSTIAIALNVADFEVDDPEARAIEGEDFPGQISNKDKSGTKSNMLGRKLLDAKRFPSIEIQSTGMMGPPGLEPGTKGFTLPDRFRAERTISSPSTELLGAGRSSLLLRTLKFSGSLCTFRRCTAGLAQDCHQPNC